MLIYNYKKEFLGIDQKELQILGFNSLADLQMEVSDFADLFVKTPGYIHNFKHVHWIDFIQYAEESEELKVLINIHKKNFKATLSLSTIFLVDSPASPAFIIKLQNLRSLSENEHENFRSDLFEKEHPKIETTTPTTFNVDTSAIDIFKDPEPTLNIKEKEELEIFQEDSSSNNEVKEEKIDLDISLSPQIEEENKVLDKKENQHSNYDPHIASQELGLPLDLIEEFIQDFIAQAKEFKEDIYFSLNSGDIDNVKTLSHKLKGVAANLRVEDAFEVLSIINTSNDIDIIKENLTKFYSIIADLAGETIDEISTPKNQEEQEENDFKLEFKDENLYIEEQKEVEEEPHQLIDEKIPELILNYSKTEAAKEIGIDKESFNELFEDFVQESYEILQKAKNAINNNDNNLCKNEILRFKGMSENMRFKEFNNVIETIINTDSSEQQLQAIQTIEIAIEKISRTGA